MSRGDFSEKAIDESQKLWLKDYVFALGNKKEFFPFVLILKSIVVDEKTDNQLQSLVTYLVPPALMKEMLLDMKEAIKEYENKYGPIVETGQYSPIQQESLGDE